MNECMYVYVYVYMFMYMYMYVYVYVCVCVCVKMAIAGASPIQPNRQGNVVEEFYGGFEFRVESI